MKKIKMLFIVAIFGIVALFTIVACDTSPCDCDDAGNVRVSYEYDRAYNALSAYTGTNSPHIQNITRVEFRGEVVTIHYTINGANRVVTMHSNNIVLAR